MVEARRHGLKRISCLSCPHELLQLEQMCRENPRFWHQICVPIQDLFLFRLRNNVIRPLPVKKAQVARLLHLNPAFHSRLACLWECFRGPKPIRYLHGSAIDVCSRREQVRSISISSHQIYISLYVQLLPDLLHPNTADLSLPAAEIDQSINGGFSIDS